MIHTNVGGSWRTVSQPYIKVGGTWRAGQALFQRDNGDFDWKLVWPRTGSPKIIGVSGGVADSDAIPIPGGTGGLPVPSYPLFYRIIGDRSQIASARIDVSFRAEGWKVNYNVTGYWHAPLNWGLYLIGTPSTNYTWSTKKVTVALEDSEVASIVPPNYVRKLWSVRDGGYFYIAPVMWENGKLGTLPIITDDGTYQMTDSWSGYGPQPPNTYIYSTDDSGTANDYTVAMGANQGGLTNWNVTIRIYNSGGAVLDTWSGSPPAPPTPATRSMKQSDFRYWPSKWGTIFDHMNWGSSGIEAKYIGENDEGGNWDIVMKGEKIGGFTLALRNGVSDCLELYKAWVYPKYRGQQILYSLWKHLVIWSPTRFIITVPLDEQHKEAMMSWGCQPIQDAPHTSRSYKFYQIYNPEDEDFLIYDTHLPMFNRFEELGLPSINEEIKW